MFPPPPAKDLDLSQPGLTVGAVSSHVEVRYRASTGEWSAPELCSGDTLAVSGLSPGLNYGQQCYEGMKAMRQQVSAGSGDSSDRIVVFRPRFHAARLARSAASVCLPPPPEELFLESVRRAVAANATLVPAAVTASGAPSSAFLYIRPVLFGASARLALAPPEEVVFAVFVCPTSPYHGADAVDGMVLEAFDRAAPRGMGAFKVGGNYAPVWRHAARARELGFGITLHLDSATRTKVEEFSTSGFLGLRTGEDGKAVLVVPSTENAIKSTTSDALVRLAELDGWTIEREELDFDSLASLTEVVAVGTAVAAVPVRSITRLSTNTKFVFANTSGAEGVESRLMGLACTMSNIQRGLCDDTEGWCWEVMATEEEVAALVMEAAAGSAAPEQQQLSSLAGRMLARLYPTTLAAYLSRLSWQ